MFDARIDVARSRNESRHRAPCRTDQSSLTHRGLRDDRNARRASAMHDFAREHIRPSQIQMPGNEKPQLLKKKASIINEE
jgi:hypothetical protein